LTSTSCGRSTWRREKVSSSVRQLGGALAGSRDLVEEALRLAAGGHVRAQQRAVAVDDGEQVVEVVGDAAGEAAQRLHLLHLLQALLERPPRRLVAHHRLHQLLAAAVEGRHRHLGGEGAAVAPTHLHLERHVSPPAPLPPLPS
jgi:hypothetical protein